MRYLKSNAVKCIQSISVLTQVLEYFSTLCAIMLDHSEAYWYLLFIWILSPLKCFFQITTFFQARSYLGLAYGVYYCSFYCFYIVSLKVFVVLILYYENCGIGRTEPQSYIAELYSSCYVHVNCFPNQESKPLFIITSPPAISYITTSSVGNSGLMAALGVGDAYTLRLQRCAYSSVKWRASCEKFFTPLYFLPSCLFFFHTFLPVHNFSKFFSFYQVTINHDLHLCLIQTSCLHVSSSTPLWKTLTVDHCLPINYFQYLQSHRAPSSELQKPDCSPQSGQVGPNLGQTRHLPTPSRFPLFYSV